MSKCLPVLFVCSIVCVLVAGTSRAETLRLRADSWMPYNGDPQSDLPGYAIEIARAIFDYHRITLDYQTMPWGDALKAVAAGEIEAVVGANRTEAEGLILPDEFIGMPRVALFVWKQNPWRYDNIASLRTVRLGVMLDYKYWPVLDDYVEKNEEPRVMKFSGEHPLEEALARLQAGDVDVVAETSSVFAWAAKNAGYAPGDFRLVYLHEGDPVFMAFADRDGLGKRYAAFFDAGLRELRRSGELEKILTRYGQKDWQEKSSSPRADSNAAAHISGR